MQEENREDFTSKIVPAVLETKLDYDTFKYIIEESAKPENKNTVEVFGGLFFYISGLIWNRIVINVSWFFHRKAFEKDKKTRNLIWYLNEKNIPTKEKDTWLQAIDDLDENINKVLKIRDKWVGHRDKVSFENQDKFFSEVKLDLSDVEPLIKLAVDIVYKYDATMNLSTSDIRKPFFLIKRMKERNPQFLSDLRYCGFVNVTN